MMVLAAHCGQTAGFPSGLQPIFNWTTDGSLGVQFFFVISGLLITWLLIAEGDQNGRVSLKRFYMRRALRILPVYGAFILVLAALSVFTPFKQSTSMWLSNLTLTTDFVKFGSWTSGHLWSLSVEEQFYLMWPATFLLIGVASKFRRGLFALSIPIILAPVFRILSDKQWHPPVQNPLLGKYVLGALLNEHYSFFNNFDSLAIGCACAVLLARHWEVVRQFLRSGLLSSSLVAVILVVGPHVLTRLHLLRIMNVSLGNTLQSCGFALLLLQSILFSESRFFRALNWWWMVRLGVLSYSIYIWQQIFSSQPGAFGLGDVWWMSFPGWLAPTFFVALISYYGLERPLFKLRAQFRKA
jgi:peptidoglycan/LPS O-acetylase OafA/YrhL